MSVREIRPFAFPLMIERLCEQVTTENSERASSG